MPSLAAEPRKHPFWALYYERVNGDQPRRHKCAGGVPVVLGACEARKIDEHGHLAVRRVCGQEQVEVRVEAAERGRLHTEEFGRLHTIAGK